MDTSAQQSSSVLLPGQAESVARARVFIATTLAKWRASALSSDDARLMVSELVTNAVRYSDGGIEVCVGRDGDLARIEVRDSSSATPEPGTLRRSDAAVVGGLGLALVEALARSWGVDQIENDGKVVWFELPLDRVAP